MPKEQTGDGILVYFSELDIGATACLCDGTGCQWNPLGCVFSLTPPGVEYAQVTDETCLTDAGGSLGSFVDVAAATAATDGNTPPFVPLPSASFFNESTNTEWFRNPANDGWVDGSGVATCNRTNTDLGNENADTFSAVIPNAVGYDIYERIRQAVVNKEELCWRIQYPKVLNSDTGNKCAAGQYPTEIFYGKTQKFKGQQMNNNTFIKTDIEVLRRTKVTSGCNL